MRLALSCNRFQKWLMFCLSPADASRSLLARHQAGGQGRGSFYDCFGEAYPADPAAGLLPRDYGVLLQCAHMDASVSGYSCRLLFRAAAPALAPHVPGQLRQLEIHVGPLIAQSKLTLSRYLFRDIAGLGTIQTYPLRSLGIRVFGVETTSSTG